MTPIVTALRRYPFVFATLAVAVVAGLLTTTGLTSAALWLLSIYALLIAAKSAVSMVRELMSGQLGVDILAITAICAAVAVGEPWAALVIVLMLTGGEALEDYAANRAKRDLTALVSNAPQTAHRVNADGGAQDVPIDLVRVGDVLQVRAAEVVPADGVLETAAGVFDESSLTGESVPVERVAGDEVLSGGVNGATPVLIRVSREAKDSQYQQIVSLVEQAAASKSRTVRLADRFAVPFTFIAYVIAGIAWAVSGEAARFAEVLVVATPCPLIIAAPVAFMAGMSRSAREGAIVKSSATLEQLYRAKSVAFDKTGTLTRGTPTLVAVRTTAGHDADEVLRLAAAAEQASAHVLAAAVVQAASKRGLAVRTVTDAEESTANGVTATVDAHRVVVGKRSYIEQVTGQQVRSVLEPGEIGVHVAVDGVPAGVLVLRDQVRVDAAATIADLRSQGIRHVVMLTGDDTPTAEHVAAELGITEVRANCLPIDKVHAVQALTARPAIMVGDGVNDAPVLAAAEIGVAMGARGSTAASESADVVVLRDDIATVGNAVRAGRRTVQVALQSIWVGIGLSIALMIVASFGVLPAILGAWLQEAVDVIAILWALRAASGGRAVRLPASHATASVQVVA